MCKPIFEILPEGYFWMPSKVLGVAPGDPDYENVCYTFDGGLITDENFRKCSNLVLKYVSRKLCVDKDDTFKEKLLLLLEHGLTYEDVVDADIFGLLAKGPADILEKIIDLFPNGYKTDLSGIFAEGCRPGIKLCKDRKISHIGELSEDNLYKMGQKVSGALLDDFIKMGLDKYMFPKGMKISRSHPFILGWADAVNNKVKESLSKNVSCKGLKLMSSSWVGKIFSKYPNIAESFALSLYFLCEDIDPCYEIYKSCIYDHVSLSWQGRCPKSSPPKVWSKMCTKELKEL